MGEKVLITVFFNSLLRLLSIIALRILKINIIPLPVLPKNSNLSIIRPRLIDIKKQDIFM